MERKWYLIDAKEKRIGRIATKIANILRGKEKPGFEYNKDGGDFVVVINSDKLDINPKKAEGKIYYHHTGYPGGIKSETLSEKMEKNSTKVIKKAVYGMLPKNRLRKNWIKRLKIYKDENHNHKAQKIKKIKEL